MLRKAPPGKPGATALRLTRWTVHAMLASAAVSSTGTPLSQPNTLNRAACRLVRHCVLVATRRRRAIPATLRVDEEVGIAVAHTGNADCGMNANLGNGHCESP